jgi:hypothetical protein
MQLLGETVTPVLEPTPNISSTTTPSTPFSRTLLEIVTDESPPPT